MIVFWLAVLVLILLTAGCVLLPLWLSRSPRDHSNVNVSQDEINKTIYIERLDDLEVERAAQRLTQTEYDELKAELQRTLLSDVATTNTNTHSVPQQHVLPQWVASALTLLVLALALGYYYNASFRGEAQQWLALQDFYDVTISRAILQPDTLPDEALADLPAFTRALQARVLKEGLDDPDSLFLLGISLLQLQAPHEAVTQFKRAYELNAERTDIMMGYAQATLFLEEGKLTETSNRLLQQVLTKEPDHQGARMLLGMGAFNAADYATAISAWQPLLAVLEPSSKAAKMLSERIVQAEQQLRQPTTASDNEKESDLSSASKRKIVATIDVSPELQQQLSASDSLFVFAKAVNGPPMPLAVARKSASQFPIKVVLDESMAMTPALTLANFPQVTVSARVSKSGDATAKPGDLQGISRPLTLDTEEVAIALTIDQVVGGTAPVTSTSQAETKDAVAAQIAVTVDLAPELAGRLQPQDILFIFAKAASGPPMPLAAIRQPAEQLQFPVKVVLDDSNAIFPSLKLSNYTEVVVGARISKQGDVVAQSGDLEGFSPTVDLALGPQAIALTVDRVVQ